MVGKKVKKAVKKAVKKHKVLKKKTVKKVKRTASALIARKPVSETTESIVVKKPAKPRKNYKLPNYKKKCIDCATFKFIKGGWSLCMQCYEKRYGKYQGEDRFLYVVK